MIYHSRVLPDGRAAEVMPLSFGRARIAVVEVPGVCYQFGQLW